MIFVHTQHSDNSLEYLRAMTDQMVRLASEPTKVAFNSYEVECPGSMGHGLAIRRALQVIPKFPDHLHVVCDADTMVVAPGWDAALNEFMDAGFDAVGVAYEDRGGFSSGDSDVQTYKGLPTFTWICIKPMPDVPWQDFDPRPVLDSNGNVSHIPQSYGRQQLLQDVGWQMPFFVRDHGLCTAAWRMVRDDDRRVLQGVGEYSEEWHLPDGTPFVVHQRGSRKHRFMSEPHSKPFYDAVNRWTDGQRPVQQAP